MTKLGIVSTALVGVLSLAIPAAAETVRIAPIRDNTLYEDPNGALSNGAGQHIFAGHTGFTTNVVRRALLAFDVAAHVPAGATIDSATLTLHLSQAPFGATNSPVTVHRVLASWGEGTSDAPFQEGGGTAATTGDATWLHRFHPDQRWATAGGEFSPTVSASRDVGGTFGFYTWGPAAQMAADVQGWLDNPATNFGWILLGVETQLQTARRFDSRQNPEPTFRPLLTVDYTVAASGAGRVPDGASVPGVPLTVSLEDNGDLTLNWGASCVAGDEDYQVYEGRLGEFTSHVPRLCTTGGATTATFAAPTESSYYLVVPRNATHEGSYGVATGGERPQSTAACLPQSMGACS